MRKMTTGFLFAVLTAAPMAGFTQDLVAEPKDSEAKSATDPELLAIRSAVEDYAAAYNSGNFEAIGKLFTDNAELIDSSGTAFRGREAIQSEYEAFFKTHPDAKLTIVVEDVKFVARNVALEEGQASSQVSPESPLSLSQYVSVYAKVDGSWLISHVRDQELPNDPGGKLQELDWLIGRWVDEAPDSLMTIDCYWHETGSYLIRDFKINIEGMLAANGTERIGWDPIQKKVRSWLFDSEGGYLEGTWVRQGNQWTIATHGYRPDGASTHATYTVTPLRENAYHLRATSRTADDEPLDDFEMTIVQRPPPAGNVPALETDRDTPSSAEQPQK